MKKWFIKLFIRNPHLGPVEELICEFANKYRLGPGEIIVTSHGLYKSALPGKEVMEDVVIVVIYWADHELE